LFEVIQRPFVRRPNAGPFAYKNPFGRETVVVEDHVSEENARAGKIRPVSRGFLFALVALLAACGNAAGGPTAAKTVVKGSVVLSPSTPVCRTGSPCSKPLPGFRLVFSRSGQVVARAKTDSRARYRVTLEPGRYTVTTPRRGSLQPRRVRVRVAASAVVNFKFDAGIR
jgi:hypothetical protein